MNEQQKVWRIPCEPEGGLLEIREPTSLKERMLIRAHEEIDQLRQRVAELELLNRQLRQDFDNAAWEAEAKLALADKWARAWRNRFIDERMAAYTEASYEMKRCYAESDANDFEAAFDAAIDASGHDSLPPHKEGGDE